MSSILDALRKLENETDDQDQDVKWPQHVDAKGTLQNKLRKRSSAGVLIVGFAVIISGVILAYAAVFHEEPAGNIAPLNSEPALPSELPQVAVEKRSPSVVPDYSSDSTERKEAPAKEQPVHPEPVHAEKEHGTGGNFDVYDSEPPGGLSGDDAERVNPGTRETSEIIAVSPVEPVKPEKVAEEGWLTLHAISWSEDPARRIAVINDNVVKEGRRVGGGIVRRIEKDYVVVEKEGVEYLLPF